MNGLRSITLLALMSLVLSLASVSRGDEPAQENIAPEKITLHPAAAPVPAVKYRLLPGRLDQIPGNAAVYYGKVTAEQRAFFGQPGFGARLDQWQDTPLADMPKANVKIPSAVLAFLERGARCKYADWQLPIGDAPYFETLLPDVQQCRMFARILASQARLGVSQGKFEDAVRTFRTNYALARNVAAGETIVNGLVGIASCGIMFPQNIEYVQQPNSPNLYWALSMLPTPFIDMRPALDVESMGIELTYPQLKDLKTARRTDEEWHAILLQFSKDVEKWLRVDNEKPRIPTVDEFEEGVKSAARKEKGMLLNDGMSKEEVLAMSDYQLALINLMHTHHELLDDGIKCFSLPYPQAIAGIDAALARAEEVERTGEQIFPLSSNSLKVLQSARRASARADRQIAVLRVFEALRIYGASHDGRLPQQLADISEVAIPDDPMTGQPFVYKLEVDRASLQGPPYMSVPLNYEITMEPNN
jgi:hypothetical protein